MGYEGHTGRTSQRLPPPCALQSPPLPSGDLLSADLVQPSCVQRMPPPCALHRLHHAYHPPRGEKDGEPRP